MYAQRTIPIVALCLAMANGCTSPPTLTSPAPLTRAERSSFAETSRYGDVRAFIDALIARTTHVRFETFGESEEGRELPLLVADAPPVDVNQAVPGPMRPVVLVMANIHAGEVEGKEAVLHLVRRLTLGDLQPLQSSAVWLFAPIYNADGNDKISLDHRAEQNGPVGGVGTRENANGLDLNRDFMKLDSSEARALVALMTRWDPDVIVDLHTTNGSHHGYHLTYAPPLNPNTDPRIAAFAREQLLPAVREAMRTRHDLRTFDYGNFATADALNTELEGFAPRGGPPTVWRTFDARPRFGTNYVGIRNRIAILSEAYSYLDFERRVKATEAFTEEIMRFVAAHAREIAALSLSTDADWARADSTREQGIASALEVLPHRVDVLVGAVESKLNPRSGKAMKAMIESVATPTSMTVYDGFVSTATRRVPAEYIVPMSANGLHRIVERKLHEHGIRVESLDAPSRRSVEQFVVSRVVHAEQAFQGHRTTSIEGAFERRDVEIPTGSLRVRTDQPLGRLAFYLLEPESDDGLTTWNFLDAGLAPGTAHPALKSIP